MKRKITLIMAAVFVIVFGIACVVMWSAEEVNVQDQTYQFLTENGFTHVQACGIMASIKMNSNFDPTATAPNDLGYGLLQWGDYRYKKLEMFADKIERPIEDVETQLMFMVDDITFNLANTVNVYRWTDFVAAETPSEAAKIFHIEYTKPCQVNLELLGKWADEFDEMYSTKLKERG